LFTFGEEMKVKVRHFEEYPPFPFTKIKFTQIDELIEFVKKSGGIYIDGEFYPFHSYQLKIDGGEAFAEILVGEEQH